MSEEKNLIAYEEKSLAQHFIATPTGLIIHGEPSYDSWEQVGLALRQVHKAVHWWIGDWLNYGERAYSEMYSQVLDETGFDYQTLRDDKWVAGRIELSDRSDNLSWGHHREVAPFEPEEQSLWLNRAEENNWTRQELHQAIRASKKTDRPIPPGLYRVIYADPPWDYLNTGFDQSAQAHYSTMPTLEICELQIPSADDAVLFLWVTSPILPEGLKVMEMWGFQYKTSMIWIKNRAPGIGWYVKTYHELLLIGVKGENMHPNLKPNSIFDYPVGKHSEKPTICYEMIEEMYDGPYLELFARIPRKGWISWGDEVQ